MEMNFVAMDMIFVAMEMICVNLLLWNRFVEKKSWGFCLICLLFVLTETVAFAVSFRNVDALFGTVSMEMVDQ